MSILEVAWAMYVGTMTCGACLMAWQVNTQLLLRSEAQRTAADCADSAAEQVILTSGAVLAVPGCGNAIVITTVGQERLIRVVLGNSVADLDLIQGPVFTVTKQVYGSRLS